jgi:hypothetical protein
MKFHLNLWLCPFNSVFFISQFKNLINSFNVLISHYGCTHMR